MDDKGVLQPVGGTAPWHRAIRQWQAFNPAIRAGWSCHAIQEGDSRWILLDPIAGPGGLCWGNDPVPMVSAVVATNGNHERAAMEWARLGAVELWAPRGSGLESAGWRMFQPGMPWIHDWEVVDLAGGGPGEVAIRIPALDLVVLGDAVVNLSGRGLEVLPDKYCSAPARLRAALRGLVGRPFERALMAHGDPLTTHASRRIAALLA